MQFVLTEHFGGTVTPLSRQPYDKLSLNCEP